MSRADLVVIVACAIAGYWAVSLWLKLRGKGSDDGDARAEEAVNLSNWYRVLGVREDAGKEEIVAAYRRRIAEYHPDKVARMGEEIRAVADRKTQQINAAYEIGIRLFR